VWRWVDTAKKQRVKICAPRPIPTGDPRIRRRRQIEWTSRTYALCDPNLILFEEAPKGAERLTAAKKA
jgi:hypothetical protein